MLALTRARIRCVVLGGLCGLSIAACSTAQLARIDPSTTLSPTLVLDSACTNLFLQLDRTVFEAGVQDVQSQRIPEFPFLRTNRFLSSFKDAPMSAAATRQWLEMLRDLDRRDRAIELGNLDAAAMTELHARSASNDKLMSQVERCGAQLVPRALDSPEAIARLRHAAQSPDSYSLTMRTLGLYPVTSLFIGRGVTQLQREISEKFADTQRWQHAPLRSLVPQQGTQLTATQLQELLSSSTDNPLRIPAFDSADLQKLFDHFAPIWTIETLSTADRPGAPQWLRGDRSGIDTARPRVYTQLSYTRLHGQVLPQFNYSLWFPERPRVGVFDILGGHLDGITVRVTVGLDGRTLMYDAMHNCGCYHMYFPPQGGLRAQTPSPRNEEALLIPRTVAPASMGQRIALYIAATSHYIEDVRMQTPSPGDDVYALLPAEELRALPAPTGGTKSLFGPDGIVAGTQRRERWLLWPMGVIEPGAMRQWGHHAVAFFGRRHFDDADLLERYFEQP